MHLDKQQAISAHVGEAGQVITQQKKQRYRDHFKYIVWSCLMNQLKCAKSDDHLLNIG